LKCYFLTKGRRVVIKNVEDSNDRIRFGEGCYFPEATSIHSSSTKNSPEIIFFDNNPLPLNKKNRINKRFISVKDISTEILDNYMADYMLQQNAGKSSKFGFKMPSAYTIGIIVFVIMIAFGVFSLWKSGGLKI